MDMETPPVQSNLVHRARQGHSLTMGGVARLNGEGASGLLTISFRYVLFLSCTTLTFKFS